MHLVKRLKYAILEYPQNMTWSHFYYANISVWHEFKRHVRIKVLFFDIHWVMKLVGGTQIPWIVER